MEGYIIMGGAIIGSLIASSGFWTFIQWKMQKNSAERQMLLGLAHDRLEYLCMYHIEKGEITKTQYENITKYLYEPYKKLGGNGTIEHLVNHVKNSSIVKVVKSKYEYLEVKEDEPEELTRKEQRRRRKEK